MAVPDFQTMMLPLLNVMADEDEHSIAEMVERLAKDLALTKEERNEMIPSSRQTTLYNRVSWAHIYLARSGVLERQRRGYYKITERGKTVLKSNPPRIDIRFLRQFPEFIAFHTTKRIASQTNEQIKISVPKTPEESLESAYQEIRDNLAQVSLAQIMTCSPVFFEQLVVELLVKMGYGGSRREAARAVGQTGDGGIDGIIDEDRLGLDTIHVQAKRWENTVGRPEIQRFVGALMGRRARKGIFITTSSFTSDARSYVDTIDFKVVLIDGKRLAEFMIDYDVGVTNVLTYQLKRIDSDYFSENG